MVTMSGFVKNGLTGLLAMALATPASVFAPLQTPPEIAKKAFASTVVVTMAEADGKLISLGSGFFVRPDQVVTNYHVIEGAAKGYVKFVGKSTLYAIDGISAMDEERDLALLKIVDAKAPVLTLAENDGVEVGETVYAIGNPEGLEGTFSQGIVSGIRDAGKDKWVQITAPISSGSSGGPVVNSKGVVIGVAVASVIEGQNLNFAIPVGPVKALMASSGPARPMSSAKPSVSSVAASFRPLRTLDAGKLPVTSLSFSPDGKHLASSGELRLWNPTTGDVQREFRGAEALVMRVAFSPDGKTLATAGTSGDIGFWAHATGILFRTLEAHTDSVNSVAFSPDGRIFASASDDGTVRLWNAATGKLLRTLVGHTEEVLSVAFSPNGRILASGSGDIFGNGNVRLWDPANGSLIRIVEGHSGSAWAIAFSPAGRVLAVGSKDKGIGLLDLATGKIVRKFEGHADTILSVAFSPDGRVLASASYDKTVRLWDAATGKLLRTLEGYTDAVWSVAFSPDGRTLAECWDTTIRLWGIRG